MDGFVPHVQRQVHQTLQLEHHGSLLSLQALVVLNSLAVHIDTTTEKHMELRYWICGC